MIHHQKRRNLRLSSAVGCVALVEQRPYEDQAPTVRLRKGTVQSVAVKKICPLPPFLARVIGNMKVNYYFSRFYCRYTWKSNHTSKRSTNLFFPGLERFIIIYEKDCRLQLIPNVHSNGNGMGFNFVALYMQVLGSNTRQWIRNVPLRSFQHSVVSFFP